MGHGERWMLVRRGAVALAFLAALVGPVFAKEQKTPGAAPVPTHAARESLGQVLARFDDVQGQIRTLSAEFLQTTRSPLLKDPIVAKGRFYLTKPDSVLWEYSAPEPMRFVVANGAYTGYFPERKRAEKRDIKRWSEQLFRFFGVGQGSKELGKFYEITLGEPGDDEKDVYLLVLSPKKHRVRKRFDEAAWDRSPLNWMTYSDLQLRLPELLLMRVDKMSMGASLEARVPFLDHKFVELAMSIPTRIKTGDGGLKYLLKKAVRGLIPSELIDRPKQGFALPLEQHGGRVFADASRFALESAESPLRALFEPAALAQLATSLAQQGEGRDPEDSPFRRTHRRWLLALLARSLVRYGGV